MFKQTAQYIVTHVTQDKMCAIFEGDMEGKVQNFRAYQHKGRPGFLVSFYHPVQKKRLTRGLGTKDPIEADVISRDLQRLCSTPAYWTMAIADLHFIDSRALEVFFGRDPDAELDKYLTTAIQAEKIDKDLLESSAALERLKAGKHWPAIDAMFGNDPFVLAMLVTAAGDLEFVLDRADFLGADDISQRLISLMKKLVRGRARLQQRVKELERKTFVGSKTKELLEQEQSSLNAEIAQLKTKNLELQKKLAQATRARANKTTQ